MIIVCCSSQGEDVIEHIDGRCCVLIVLYARGIFVCVDLAKF